MKLPSFIYTRRWFVIIGLVVTLGCLVGVLIYQSGQDRNREVQADNLKNQESNQESSSSAQPSNQSTSSASTPTTKPTSTHKASSETTVQAEQAMLAVKTAIEAKDGQKLYELLSAEMKSVFTVDSVATAFAQAEGLTITPVEDLRIAGEWARQNVQAIDPSGQTMHFGVVLHLENGQWKLYGTEKLG